MSPTRRNRDGLLARVNFPLYTVQMLTNRHVLVGGGGGSAKTGVANGFEVYELSHDGEKFVAEEVVRHETGPSVVMNCATYNNNKLSMIVAGQESHCQVYHVQSVLISDVDEIETLGTGDPDLKHRKPISKSNDADSNKNTRRLKFVIKPSDTIQTDFLENEPLQRVVRICRNSNMMATGGTDGYVRLWKFPSLKPLHTLKAHKQEIDDIDFSPYDNLLITIAKDGLAVLWNLVNGKEIRKLSWPQPEGSKYLYKRCRFGQIEGENKQNVLYMLANPTGRAGKQKAFLQKWRPDEGNLSQVVPFDESLSALAVRDDGRFVAIGTMFSGSVSIYIAFSFQRILHVPGAHSMFVTGLEFLPVSIDDNTVTSIAETAVLSISVDNQVYIHALPFRRSIPVWLAVAIIVFTLVLAFLFCAFMGI